ncbi:hypothetical protein F4780DRAFT_2138 [Xylariomycetidae sp. FL0641]|nr:hypothetical protein F4780DRAFT_2138 [Xylariomycetidae sp. FL0641]
MLSSISVPSTCLSETWIWQSSPTSVQALGNPHNQSCWPQGRDLATTISPAICPSGYFSACDMEPKMDASETVWGCCPIGYSCDGGLFGCVQHWNITKVWTLTDIDSMGNIVSTVIVDDIGLNNAHSIRVGFHSSDLSPAASTAIAPAPSYSNPLASPTTVQSPSEGNSNRLSSGAVAGAAIGATIGFLLLLSVASWVTWKRYRAKKIGATWATGATQTESKESAAGPGGYPPPDQSYAATAISELPTTLPARELPTL